MSRVAAGGTTVVRFRKLAGQGTTLLPEGAGFRFHAFDCQDGSGGVDVNMSTLMCWHREWHHLKMAK